MTRGKLLGCPTITFLIMSIYAVHNPYNPEEVTWSPTVINQLLKCGRSLDFLHDQLKYICLPRGFQVKYDWVTKVYTTEISFLLSWPLWQKILDAPTMAYTSQRQWHENWYDIWNLQNLPKPFLMIIFCTLLYIKFESSASPFPLPQIWITLQFSTHWEGGVEVTFPSPC